MSKAAPVTPEREYWGQWLSRSLANDGRTQTDFAEYVGINGGRVTQWKAGGVPTPKQFPKIAEYFGVDRLRLAVTIGQIPPEVAGVDRLPLPDDAAQTSAERAEIERIVTKRVSRETDRDALLLALAMLRARDTVESSDKTSDKKLRELKEVLEGIEQAVEPLRRLLRPEEDQDDGERGGRPDPGRKS